MQEIIQDQVTTHTVQLLNVNACRIFGKAKTIVGKPKTIVGNSKQPKTDLNMPLQVLLPL